MKQQTWDCITTYHNHDSEARKGPLSGGSLVACSLEDGHRYPTT